MKKNFIFILMALSFALGFKSKAQTTLVASDILFTGYSGIASAGIAPDTISFVVLTPLSAGTTIYFTERGYQGAGWQASGTTEGTISWTSGSALAIGQEVEIAGLGASAAKVAGVPNGNVATVSGGNVTTGLSLSNAGDQVIAFQGGAGDPTSGAATMIAGINWALSCGSTTDAGWNGAGCTYGPQTSVMPPGLTGGVNAFLAGTAGATPNNDHGKFNCNGCPYSTVAALKAAIMTKANWQFSSTGITVLNLPPGCNYYGTSCTNPTIGTQPTNKSVCFNSNTSFSIAATGASSYQWQENTGSGFTNITNGGIYSGATTAILNLTGLTSQNGYLYRCIAIGTGTCQTTSNSATLTISAYFNTSSQTSVSCNGGANGSATINASGGISPYTYSWAPSGGSGATASGLSAGTYTVTVTDAISCSTTKTFTITQPTALVVNPLSQTNIACFGGSNGAASINTPSGGAGGYTYNWTPGNPTGDGTTSVTGLTSGTWSCTVTDANSCTRTQTFNITQPASALSASNAVTNVLCFGASTGAINLTPAGGTAPYTFNWGGGITTEDRTGLLASAYTCTITDANGCTITSNATVTQPASAIVTSTAVSNVLCFGNSTGSATVTATGGTGSYTYLWNSAQTTSVITGLNTGVRTVTVTDANGCSTTTSISISEPNVLTANASASSILCNGGVSTITVSATGGTASYTGIGTFTANAGTQTYTLTDANGCSATTSISVSEPSALSSSQNVTLCAGQSITVGTSTYNASGTYTNVLSAINGCDSTVTTNLIVNLAIVSSQTVTLCAGQSIAVGSNTYTTTGIYTNTFTSVSGCDSTVTTDLTVNNVIDITTSLSGLTITANESNATYQWIDCDNANQPIASETNQSFTTSVNGNYAVIVSQNSCSDASACVNISTVGIKEVNNLTGIKLYPNPTNGTFTILGMEGHASISIYNSIGELVKSIPSTENNAIIDLSSNSSGIYFIKIKNNKGESIQKLIKQ